MTGRIAGVLAGILVSAMVSPAAAQSLGDVARQEAARREQVKAAGKVFTNADLPASAVLAPPTAVAPADGQDTPAAAESAPARLAGAAPPPTSDTGAAVPKAPPTDDEAGWRARAEPVNTALTAARIQVRQLRALSDRLSLEAQASDPAAAARAEGERAEMRSQIAKAEEAAAAATAARDALAQDARVSGVPPGWIQ